MSIYDEQMQEAMQTISSADDTKLAILESVVKQRRDDLHHEKLLKFALGEPVSWESEEGDGPVRKGIVVDRNKRTLAVVPVDDEDERFNIKPDKLQTRIGTDKGSDSKGKEDAKVSQKAS